MSATHIDELPEIVRSKVLKNIAAAAPATPTIDREVLAQRIVDGFGVINVKLAELKPDVELLWAEFETALHRRGGGPA